jgi:hypothetical protein
MKTTETQETKGENWRNHIDDTQSRPEQGQPEWKLSTFEEVRL